MPTDIHGTRANTGDRTTAAGSAPRRTHHRTFKALLAASALITGLVLTGCSSHPSTGTVTEKRYEEAYTSYVPMCFSTNAQGVCTMMIPVPETSGPFWVLELANGKDHWTVLTNPTDYDGIHVGDTWKDA